MNTVEALSVLADEARKYHGESYASLQRLRENAETVERIGPSGTTYQVEVSAVWDNKPGGVLRLFFTIDDGGWRAFYPVTRCGLVEAEGTFDGEVE